MAYRLVDPASLPAGPGPHPAASVYDKRVGEHLGLSAFEAYFVELPPGAATVRHDHADDRVEDLYVVLRGSGCVIVDDERIPVGPRQFVAVSLESSRQIVAGDEGLELVAVCGGGSG